MTWKVIHVLQFYLLYIPLLLGSSYSQGLHVSRSININFNKLVSTFIFCPMWPWTFNMKHSGSIPRNACVACETISYAWLPRKCDYQESVTTGQTNRQTPDKVIPMCRYASQATQKLWQHSQECMCLLRNIAMRDYLESVTTGQTDGQTDRCQTIRIYHDFVQEQGNPLECQRFAVHDEACRVVDVANLWHDGGFPFPCTKSWLIIFLLPLSIPITKLHFLLSKTTPKRFQLRKRRQLGLIMTSRHCISYDVTRCSLKRSCLYQGR